MDRTEQQKRQAQSGPETSERKQAAPVGRRAALARLGLAAGVGYLAPTLVLLKSAKAKHGDDGGGPPWGGNSKPSSGRPSNGHGHGHD